MYMCTYTIHMYMYVKAHDICVNLYICVLMHIYTHVCIIYMYIFTYISFILFKISFMQNI